MIEMCDKHRAKLASGESVLWYGKTSPVLFYRGWTAPVVMGAFWSLIVYCYPVRDLLSKSRAPATLDMGMLLGLGVFALIAVVLVLSPVIHLVISRSKMWAVTTKRVICFWGPFERDWRLSELRLPVYVNERKNGHKDFVFCRKVVRSSKGSSIQESYIENVAPEEVPALDSAFRRLAETRDSLSRSPQGKLERMLDEFYNPKPSSEREVGEYY